MYRPSGDHRGEYSPSEPGTVELCRVFKFSRRIARGEVDEKSAIPVWKINEVPSGDQPRSPIPVITSSGWPPSVEIRYIFQGCPGPMPWKAIFFPSGDQRGWYTCKGGKVSCSRALPSALLFHRSPSGKLVYATHCPSFETATPSADTPDMYGT